jgi:DNA (cytosine-5)-methyltransferase 1
MGKLSAVDLFCGIGGLSYGLLDSGINVCAGIDLDDSCEYTYESNCGSHFINKSVADVTGKELEGYYNEGDVKILAGCAPCQPFSSYTYKDDKKKDDRWQLLYEFSRLVKESSPEIVTMENVPTLLNFKAAPVFNDFVESLEKLGYNVWYDVVYAPDYGIPQKRKRLVLLASKIGKISLIPPTHSPEEYITVKDTIGQLEKIESGGYANSDFVHKASQLSELNLKRIRQSKPGGSWKRDWDEELKLACHISDKGKSYTSIYGRMKWDEPAPTMTTYCTGIGNGRFGHPEQDRAISLREAALLQSFPADYKFADSIENLKPSNTAKHIGNAVPPKLGKIIGESIKKHLKEHNYAKE